MKLIKFFALALTILTLLLTACNDDESADESVKDKFLFGDKAVTLKDAKVYFRYQEESPTHMFREYVITDGTYDVSTGYRPNISSYSFVVMA